MRRGLPTPTPDETVEFGSDAHLRLLERLVGEGRQAVLSLDGEILLQLGDRRVLVTPSAE